MKKVLIILLSVFMIIGITPVSAKENSFEEGYAEFNEKFTAEDNLHKNEDVGYIERLIMEDSFTRDTFELVSKKIKIENNVVYLNIKVLIGHREEISVYDVSNHCFLFNTGNEALEFYENLLYASNETLVGGKNKYDGSYTLYTQSHFEYYTYTKSSTNYCHVINFYGGYTILDPTFTVTGSNLKLYADHITYALGQVTNKYPGTSTSYSYSMNASWTDPNLNAWVGGVYKVYYRHTTGGSVQSLENDGRVLIS